MKIKVLQEFFDKDTLEYRARDAVVEYKDDRAKELIAGGWAKAVKTAQRQTEKAAPKKNTKKK